MSKIQVFVGDLLEESSEIQFLNKLVEDFNKRQKDAILFANFHAGKHNQQIDFFVITSNSPCVVELKNITAPICGQINGPWELRKSDGTIIRSLGARNPYRQALSAKYAISDEMLHLTENHSNLPQPPQNKPFHSTIESIVCIFPEIPLGSNLTPGDYKTYVKGYADFLEFLLSSNTNPGWTKDGWILLARKLGLQEQGLSDLIHPNHYEALKQSDLYISRFGDFYGKELPKFVPTEMLINEKLCTLESFLSFLSTEKSLQIVGPSGCGKTHLIKHLGMLAISNGYAPMFVAAKYFLGKLSDLLDRSIAHLYTGKALELLKTVSAAGRQPFLILDGLNECHPKLLSTLIENLQAFALRKECPIVTTSQTEIVFLTESKGPIVRMYHLKPSEKPGVLAVYLSEPPPIFTEILELLKTPLEICLAAESSRELEKNVTKYELFNSYTRKCLAHSENSSLAFRTLVKLGKIMGERLVTTLPQSEFNRIAELAAESVGTKPEIVPGILKSGLMKVEQGYITFFHEMIQRFFEAEAFLSEYDSITIRAAEIEKPRNHHLAEFILGATGGIEGASALLRSTPCYNLLLESIKGHYGKHVEAAILSDINDIFQKAHGELQNLNLIFKQDTFEINIRFDTKTDWSPYELALLGAVGQALTFGFFFEKVVNLIRETDRKCFQKIEKMEPKEEVRLALQDRLFYSLYVVQSLEKNLPINLILHGIPFWPKEKSPNVENSMKIILDKIEEQPPGILFLLCTLTHHGILKLSLELPNLLRTCWQTHISNLQLEVLDAIGDSLRTIEDPLRSELIEHVKALDWEGNISLSSAIVELLARCDGLDVVITDEDAMSEVQQVLSNPEDPRSWENAYGIYSRIFEDVFQGVYNEVISYKLSEDDRGRFFTMASLGAPPGAFFADSILRHLLEINDPATTPAFKKWAEIPNPESHMIQGSVEAFLWAIIGMARYTDLPPVINRPLRDDEAAWQSYGEILFWLHKPSIPEKVMKKNCAPCWQRLLSGYIHAAVDPLMLIVRQMSYAVHIDKGFLKDIVAAFPVEIRTILERGLKIRSSLTSLFRNNPWTKQEHGKFIIEMLGKIGNESTIPLLEPLLDLPEIGVGVANAIRSIRSHKVD